MTLLQADTPRSIKIQLICAVLQVIILLIILILAVELDKKYNAKGKVIKADRDKIAAERGKL